VIDIKRSGAEARSAPDTFHLLALSEHAFGDGSGKLRVSVWIEPGERSLHLASGDRASHALTVGSYKARPFPHEYRLDPCPEPLQRGPHMTRNCEAAKGAEHFTVERQLVLNRGGGAGAALNNFASEFGKCV
jgi:hypothetical protein